MGNDIKLPVVQRKDLQTNQKSLLNESKEHLLYEIDKISQRVASITQQIDHIEHKLKHFSRNIDYYTLIITEMSNTLHQLEIEEVNASLSRENYIEKGKRYLELLEVDGGLDLDEDCEEYSAASIANLQKRLELLNSEVTLNEEYISKKAEQLSSD
ncbi:uncharacterized protein LOC123011097 [Tribolium madens]|uniref:uncharacterized protein LOC123011097 n=1 Tax=Tribolium madens TaxID=41895 RepID=UPI001CF75063|nr:uncharacterized protein LOC123011097 [Tribolium madens]